MLALTWIAVCYQGVALIITQKRTFLFKILNHKIDKLSRPIVLILVQIHHVLTVHFWVLQVRPSLVSGVVLVSSVFDSYFNSHETLPSDSSWTLIFVTT